MISLKQVSKLSIYDKSIQGNSPGFFESCQHLQTHVIIIPWRQIHINKHEDKTKPLTTIAQD